MVTYPWTTRAPPRLALESNLVAADLEVEVGNPVIHYELFAADAEAMKSFYGTLFDWSIERYDNDYQFIRTGDGQISGGIFQLPQGMPAPAQLTVYVQVDDVAAVMEQATELGATAVFGPKEIPGQCTYAIMADPEGRVFGLMHPEG